MSSKTGKQVRFPDLKLVTDKSLDQSPDEDEQIEDALTQVERIRKARVMAERGKSAKKIAAACGLDLETAKSVIRAVTGSGVRSSNRDLLSDQLRRVQALLPLAEAAYTDVPNGYNAGALATISGEVRNIMRDLEDKSKPEEQALRVIREALQPLVTDILRDAVVELRKSRTKCLAVAQDAAAERAMRSAFDDLTRSLGTATKTRYEVGLERLAIVLACNANQLKVLARETAAREAAAAESKKNEILNAGSVGGSSDE